MFVICLPAFSFSRYMCTLLALMMRTILAKLKLAVAPVAPNKMLCKILRRFDRVVRSIISVLTDYESDAVFCVDMAYNTFDDIHNGFTGGSWCWWYVSNRLMRLFLVGSGVGFSPRAGWIDRWTVEALSLWALGVNCSIRGMLINLGAGMAQSIEITFAIPSWTNVIMSDVVSMIRNKPMVSDKSFDCYSSAIPLYAILAVGSWSE